MTENTPDAGGEVLSVDAAVSLIQGAPVEQEEQAPEAPVEAAVGAEEPSEETIPEDDAGEADEPGDSEGEAEEIEAAAEPINPPQWWSKEAKARFAELPPDLQAEVMAQEGKREEVVTKAKAEAKQQAEEATQRIKQVEQIVQGLNEVLPRALQNHQDKWADVDWAAWAEQDSEAAFKGRLQFEQEQRDLAELVRKQQEAVQVQQTEFVKAEYAKLAEVAPDLYGNDEPVVQKRKEVGQFLLTQGIPAEALGTISAAELSLAYDAMRWREHQAKAKQAAANPKPIAPPKVPASPAVKAAAAPPVRTSQQRSVEQIRGRLARSNDPVADGVALLQAMRKR